MTIGQLFSKHVSARFIVIVHYKQHWSSSCAGQSDNCRCSALADHRQLISH